MRIWEKGEGSREKERKQAKEKDGSLLLLSP